MIGELYEVDAEALDRLDRLERLGESQGYLRVNIQVEAVQAGAGEPITVQVYAKSAEKAALESQRIGPLAEYTLEHAAKFKRTGA